jgi:hypothetical protein
MILRNNLIKILQKQGSQYLKTRNILSYRFSGKEDHLVKNRIIIVKIDRF